MEKQLAISEESETRDVPACSLSGCACVLQRAVVASCERPQTAWYVARPAPLQFAHCRSLDRECLNRWPGQKWVQCLL